MGIEVSDTTRAVQYFRALGFLDLSDNQGNTDEGMHIASAGGTWQILVNGFGGLRILGGGWPSIRGCPTTGKASASASAGAAARSTSPSTTSTSRYDSAAPTARTEEVIVSGKPVQLTAGTPAQVALEEQCRRRPERPGPLRAHGPDGRGRLRPRRAQGAPLGYHRGFETVTYMIDGVFRHQDSNGGGGGRQCCVAPTQDMLKGELPQRRVRPGALRRHGRTGRSVGISGPRARSRRVGNGSRRRQIVGLAWGEGGGLSGRQSRRSDAVAANATVPDDCLSSLLYGPVGSGQVRLGRDSVQHGLVGCN